MSFSTLLRISRPRFWHYILGPMLIYFASSGFFDEIYTSWSRGGTDWIFQLIMLIIILGYFALPANLWIYGRNDIADGDTDKFNSKKGTYESKIEDSDTMKRKLTTSIWIWNMGYIVIGAFLIFCIAMITDCFPWAGNGYMCETILQKPWVLLQSFLYLGIYRLPLLFGILFIFLTSSYLYSCKPLRAKSKPFIDGIMNILYIAIPFSVITLDILSYNYYKLEPIYSITTILSLLIASWFWVIAMHCYSAIPDIQPDRQAGLNTTAVYLGKNKSLIYCAILYLLSALLSFPTLGWFSIVGGIVYISMIIISYYSKDIFALYKFFPYINLIIGFLLFRYIFLYL